MVINDARRRERRCEKRADAVTGADEVTRGAGEDAAARVRERVLTREDEKSFSSDVAPLASHVIICRETNYDLRFMATSIRDDVLACNYLRANLGADTGIRGMMRCRLKRRAGVFASVPFDAERGRAQLHMAEAVDTLDGG